MIKINNALIDSLCEIAIEAGEAIMNIYKDEIEVEIKSDSSPLTKADLISNEIIVNHLKNLCPNIPILSEESADISYEIRSSWKNYWLVDPLDGTKEFLKKNGEFTVNIALINNHVSILGIVYAPAKKKLYWGTKSMGSFIIKENNKLEKLELRKDPNNTIKLVTSSSHPSKKLDSLLKNIKNYEISQVGSSLKFCLLAENKFDCYPRFGPTSEWDIAAGEAILNYAGGIVVDSNGDLIKYNTKDNYINGDFIASVSNEVKDLVMKSIDLTTK